MADGRNEAILLDVEADEFCRLTVIDEAPSEFPGRVVEGRIELPAVVTFDNGHVIDGRHVVAALQRRSAQGKEESDLTIKAQSVRTFSDVELAAIRAEIRPTE
jgi:hypothetical protein